MLSGKTAPPIRQDSTKAQRARPQPQVPRLNPSCVLSKSLLLLLLEIGPGFCRPFCYPLFIFAKRKKSKSTGARHDREQLKFTTKYDPPSTISRIWLFFMSMDQRGDFSPS